MKKNFNQNNNSNGGGNYQNTSARSVTTTANIQLEISEWKCDITSDDIENFLQSKIDAIVDKAGGTRVPVEVRSMQYNKIYAPIVLMLPTTVISGRGKRFDDNQFKNIPATFARGMSNPKSGKSILLNSSVTKAISPYTYKKHDIASMEDPKERSKLQLSRQQLIQIKSFSKPKMKKAQGGREYVIVILDCLKIIQDMLLIQGDNRRYDFEVMKVNKHSSGRCLYKVIRYIPDNLNKNFSGGYDLDNELSRMFMIGRHNGRKK